LFSRVGEYSPWFQCALIGGAAQREQAIAISRPAMALLRWSAPRRADSQSRQSKQSASRDQLLGRRYRRHRNLDAQIAAVVHTHHPCVGPGVGIPYDHERAPEGGSAS
jgi:hypothetical protein